MATDEITKYPLRDAEDCLSEAHALICYMTSSRPDELICEEARYGFTLVALLLRERILMAKKCVEAAKGGES